MEYISIKDIQNAAIDESKDLKISMKSLEEMPLNKAIDAVRYIQKYPHVILCDLTPNVRDIMDLAIRSEKKSSKKWRSNGPCQNYKCEFYRGINNPDQDNNCCFEYLQENCIDYKE